MKKEISIIFSCFFISMLIFFSGCIVEKNSAGIKTIYVDNEGSKDFTSIQDAINTANEGDTVFVYAGTYNENLVINKSINLIGENKNSTIIIGNGDNDGIYIGKNQINVSGFTVNSGLGTRAVRIVTSFNTISDNNLSDNSWGIYMNNAPNNIISKNIIGNNIEGIQMWNSDECTFSGNIVFSNYSHSNFGVYGDSCNQTIFSNNTVFKYNRGVQFFSSDNCTIYRNVIYSTGVALNFGNYCSYNIISYNNIYSNACGINFNWCNNNMIFSNNFINNTDRNGYENRYSFTGELLNNSWDFHSVGNYWSDYNGTDFNDDEIGDTPYIIPGDGMTEDRFPLMSPIDI
jgi:parallel beta-helix repeat protein